MGEGDEFLHLLARLLKLDRMEFLLLLLIV